MDEEIYDRASKHVAPVNWEMLEDYSEKKSMSPRPEGFSPHLAMGMYNYHYCSMAAPMSSIPDLLPFW